MHDQRRDAEAHLVLALDVSEDGLWDWNVVTGECFMSAGWFRMLGHEPEPGPGHVSRWQSELHPEDAPNVTRAIEDHFEGRTPRLDIDHRFRHRSGSWVWVRARGKLVERDADGRPLRFVGRNVDVTEWYAAAEARRHADTLLRTVISHAPFVLTVTDQDGIVTHSEGAMLPALGRAPGELVGQSVFEVLGALPAHETDGRVTTVAALAHRVLSGETVESTTHLPNGVVHGNVSVPLRGPAGDVIGIVGLSFDITERLRLSEQLRHAQKMEAVGQLAGGIAHDFNNLLTVIGGNVELARAALPLDHPVRNDLHEVEHAADRARALVRQLLTFSRKQPATPTVQRLAEVVRSTARLLQRVIGEEIALQLEMDDTAHVRIDRGQLEQVLMNLAVNARDAMEGAPGVARLQIAMSRRTLDAASARPWSVPEGDWVLLEVSDTGRGMDEATLEHAFEPFFTTKEIGKGTGLGLATVYGIVRAAGGTVRIDSAPGKGTKVSVLLPVAAPSSESAAEPAHPVEEPGGSATILVVEDDAPVRSAVRRILERRGHTVIEARDGMDALSIWPMVCDGVDAVVTDLRMPRLGGRALAAELRRQAPDLPVLLMSGYANQPCSEDGAHTAFVSKPFTTDSLVRALAPLLTRGRRVTPAERRDLSWELDAEGVITRFGGDFALFAVENSAPELTSSVIGKPLWDFISDETTRRIYQRLFLAVRNRREKMRLRLRCDGPDREREIEVTASPSGAGIELKTHVVRSISRAPIPLLDRDEPRATDRIEICSWCKRVSGGGPWVDIEEAARRLPRLAERPLPSLAHVCCPACELRVQTELARYETAQM